MVTLRRSLAAPGLAERPCWQEGQAVCCVLRAVCCVLCAGKKAKLDPDTAVTTLTLQQKRLQQGAGGKGGAAGSKEAVGAADGGDGPEGGLGQLGMSLNLSGGSTSRQELLERLHKKIEVRCAVTYCCCAAAVRAAAHGLVCASGLGC